MSHKHGIHVVKSVNGLHELKELGGKAHFGVHKTHVGMGKEIIKSPKPKLHY